MREKRRRPAKGAITPDEIRVQPFELRSILISNSPRLEIVWLSGKTGQTSSFQIQSHGYAIVNKPATSIRRINSGASYKVEWPAMSEAFTPAGWRLDAELTSNYEATALLMDEEFFRGSANDDLEYRPDRFRPITGVQSPTGAMLMAAMHSLITKPDEWPLLAENVASTLASHLMQHFSGKHGSFDPFPPALPRERLKRVMDFVEANLHRVIHLNELASVASLSQFHFARSFRQAMGITPVRYVYGRRIERAKVLLRNIELPLAVIAFDCGFSSQSHFTTSFKRETGLTPAQYRAQL